MTVETSTDIVELDLEHSIWDRVFSVAPLVVIGTRDEDGRYNLAPKHQAMLLGWSGHFGFVCTPSHATYHNSRRERFFTVSYPNPSGIVVTSLTASPRSEDSRKPVLNALPQRRAKLYDSVFVADSYLFLECQLHQIVDGFGDHALIVGKIRRAEAREESIRRMDRDDENLIRENPLLTFIAPDRYARTEESHRFPFPEGFRY